MSARKICPKNLQKSFARIFKNILGGHLPPLPPRLVRLWLPSLRIHDVSVREDRQQCILLPTPEANVCKNMVKSNTPATGDALLWKENTAIKEAKCRAAIRVPMPSEKEYLGQLLLTFWKYTSCSFKWLLENDVGYLI